MIREQPGQPIKMSSGKRGMNFSIYVDPDELNALEEIRWRERKSMSAIVRRALDEYIRAHAAGNEIHRLDNWQENPQFRAIPTILAQKTTWSKYLNECSTSERVNILKHVNDVRKIAITSGPLK